MRVRLSVSPGRLSGPDLARAEQVSVVAVADPISTEPPAALHLAVATQRIDPGRPLAFAKTAQYLAYLAARAEARAGGADDALLLNTAGAVCETATANLFARLGDRLVTPDLASGPLPGITREVVIELAARLDTPVLERPLELEELSEATELFTTSGVIGLQPVASVARDGVSLWRGDVPGDLTSRLASEYALLLAEECG